MNLFKTCIIAVCFLYAFACQASSDIKDPASLFSEPEALKTPDGSDLITGKAMGCPFPFDWTGDGVNDLVLGAKQGMGTATGSIWLIKNTGSNAKPAFDMATAWQVLVVDEAGGDPVPLKIGCG